MSGGPAQKAGLKPGDVIVKFENREITTAEELIVAVRAQSVGDRVKVIYLRNGKEFSATLTLRVNELNKIVRIKFMQKFVRVKFLICTWLAVLAHF
jgi:S1-C subfamily serine protease